MKTYPPVPHVDSASEGLFESGHLWVQELIDGGRLRFRLRSSGRLEFGDDRRTLETVPPRYRSAVRHVRETLDRGALRAAVDDVETVTFVAEATYRRAVPYDLAETPPALGLAVLEAGTPLSPDAVDGIYDRLGLETVPVVDREVRAADFDADPDAVPESAWYDGPAAGIVVRNKTGDRARLPNPELELDYDPEPFEADAATLAERLATDELLERVADRTEAFERLFEAVLRRHHGRLLHRETAVDREALRSAVGRRVREWHDGNPS